MVRPAGKGARMQADEVQRMADEVAGLMASRLGGARRGTSPDLQTMLRRRGGALPRSLRRQALRLAEAERLGRHPLIGRQMDLTEARRAHAALLRHLKPLGVLSRWQGRTINTVAAVVLGLLLLGAAVLWVMVRRGTL